MEKILVEKPSSIIIRRLKEMIELGVLKPNDTLPPERKLSEQFGVGRSHVREALKKMEFFGLLKTQPQSGTVVVGLGAKAIEGLISNMLEIDNNDFFSLIETRVLLEVKIAGLAAKRREKDDLDKVLKTLEAYEKAVEENQEDITEKDFLFHLSLCRCAKNSTLKSLMSIITPDILNHFEKERVCTKQSRQEAIEEHREIYNAIESGDSAKAREVMEQHLAPIVDAAKKKYDLDL
ncbi:MULTISPECIES: FadR/GntR family transcriptional regulator [Flammeovirga]|uniref:FadR family transcriptional regulator n=1 Tax=Flammeovirga agarivorans TaxID=2726742 RepID=A0A7X8SQ81_9BACT|nr:MULTISPECIES: FadR/GntR family transcriptional regulator [Flammeovirga]NLR94409.1 FadR family transcriptional regulator [Flammeovirga agarivorans]